MKKTFIQTALVSAASLLAFSPPAQAQTPSEPLVMTIRTNIYGYQGPTNSFTIYLGSTEKDVEYYVEGPKISETIYVDPYTLGQDPEGGNTAVATSVTLSVTETDNSIRIYGDPSKLDYIDLHGCYLSSVDLNADMTNLSVVDFSHNELTQIDLSPFTSLNSIDINDNAFTNPQKMKIGTNHPNLNILYVGINDVIDPELNISNFPNLIYFSAYNNYGLTSIDPSGCPYLLSLQVDATNISTIDVSKNPQLMNLNVSQTKVTQVDLSNNPNLSGFYANHDGSMNTQYKLTEIDLSKNTKLVYLDLGGNNLTSIDLSHNPELWMLYLMRNKLTELDLSNCKKLARVDVSNNYLTFATLPIPQPGWDYIYYRSPLPCNFKYRVGETIDFSADVIRAPYKDAQGNTITPVTDARVFTQSRLGDPEMIDPDSGVYTYEDGKITFNQAFDDPVFIRFYNSVFNDWDLDSQSFSVKTDADFDAPSTAFTFTPYSSMNGKDISFNMGVSPMVEGVNYPAEVTISVGGETIDTFAVSSAALSEEGNNISFKMPSAGGKVDVYVTDGFWLSALDMDQVKMSAIDLSQAEDLYTLSITNANLQNIDLQYNRALRYLNLSGNLLSTMDLTPVRGDFEKWELRTINLSNNQLTSIKSDNVTHYVTLDVSNNWFSTFDFKYYEALENLDISGNRLSGEFNLEAQNRLQNLDISNNQINTLVLGTSYLNSLDVRNNNLSFATLPARNIAQEYQYAPQNVLSIIPGGPSINLSAQNVGLGTSYVWKYADSQDLLPSSLYTIEGGVTRFDESLVGTSVYCEMTNASFPDFNSQPLTTTAMMVMDKPTNVVARFTPAQSGHITVGFRFAGTGANAAYIDWRGDGSQYDEYVYDSNNTQVYRDGTAYAGKTAVVYTYGDPADVVMMFMNNPGEGGSSIALTDFDATPMTKAQAFDIHNAKLKDGTLKLPKSPNLREAVFDGSSFTTEIIRGEGGYQYPNLQIVNLANNKYESFDINNYPTTSALNISDNQISNLTMPKSNNSLYQLMANNNQIGEIDLSGMNSLGELLLSTNKLYTIDITPVVGTLHALALSGNYFTFATLPKLTEVDPDLFNYYDYFSQQPMEVECKNGIVDLSDQQYVESIVRTENGFEQYTGETVYRWFLGNKQSDVYYDYYYEMFVGEELEGPEQNPNDPEYITENGRTHFLVKQKSAIIGAMTNPAMPSLILYTRPFYIDAVDDGVDNIITDDNGLVDVYTISGMLVKSQTEASEALQGLAPGLYIVGGKKVLVK